MSMNDDRERDKRFLPFFFCQLFRSFFFFFFFKRKRETETNERTHFFLSIMTTTTTTFLLLPSSSSSVSRSSRSGSLLRARRQKRHQRGGGRAFSSISSSSSTTTTRTTTTNEERGREIERITRAFRRSFTLLRKKKKGEEEEGKREDDETRLVVRAIRERDVLDAAKVFRESFSGSPDEKPRSFVLRYLLEACVAEDEEDDEEEKSDDANAQMKKSKSGGNAASNPYEVCFVGVTTKTNPETQEVTEDEVISLVSVALDVRSRIADDPNPPPSDAPYVCNMAVASEHRNKGVAKAMLEAIGEFVPSVGGCDVWLHVREVDGKAVRVYERFGFETVKVDEKNPLLNLVMNRKESRKGRALMRKVLAEGCNFIV